DFEPRRIRPAPSRSCERHFQNSRRRQHGHAFDRMIGDPREHLLVEMIEPTGRRTALAEPEQRVVKRRIDEIGSFGCSGEPKSLPVPGIERETAWIRGTVK